MIVLDSAQYYAFCADRDFGSLSLTDAVSMFMGAQAMPHEASAALPAPRRDANGSLIPSTGSHRKMRDVAAGLELTRAASWDAPEFLHGWNAVAYVTNNNLSNLERVAPSLWVGNHNLDALKVLAFRAKTIEDYHVTGMQDGWAVDDLLDVNAATVGTLTHAEYRELVDKGMSGRTVASFCLLNDSSCGREKLTPLLIERLHAVGYKRGSEVRLSPKRHQVGMDSPTFFTDMIQLRK